MNLVSEADARNWFSAVMECEKVTIHKLEQLVELLRAENCRQNLVSSGSLDQIWVRHFADSAQLLSVSRETPRGPWLDLGSGAGFPGLVIAICKPEIEVTLVENRAKRIAWLEDAIDHLEISNANVAKASLQSLETAPMATISARAFAPLPRLIALSSRFSTPETQWVLPKGRNGRQELLEMSKAIQSMFHVEQSLTDPNSVILVGRGVPKVHAESRR